MDQYVNYELLQRIFYKSSRPVVTYYNSHGVTGGGESCSRKIPRGAKWAAK